MYVININKNENCMYAKHSTFVKVCLSLEIRLYINTGIGYLCGIVMLIFFLVFSYMFQILYNKISITFIKRVIKTTE